MSLPRAGQYIRRDFDNGGLYMDPAQPPSPSPVPLLHTSALLAYLAI